jgi:hypothetical protein
MSPVTQPWSGHGNVVGGTFSLCLDQQFHTGEVLAFPGRERFQDLQSPRFRVHINSDVRSVFRRRLVSVVFDAESLYRHLDSDGLFEFHLFAFLVGECVCKGIEGQVTCDGHCRYNLW